MTLPHIRIYTEKDKFIDREMNQEEAQQYLLDQAKAQETKAEAEAKAAQKAALLDRLGITEDEAKLLLA
jgi:hypothetical protein